MTRKRDHFTSKSNVLKFLKPKLKKSRIEKLFDFTVVQWTDDKKEILQEIQRTFQNSTLIVRSSAIGEDSIESSNAGNFESILNVPSKSAVQIQRAVNTVIKSYSKKQNSDGNNQILIQDQTPDIKTSGVVFTKTLDIGAPYYVINYEESSSTVGVTGGLVDNIVKLYKDTPPKQIPSKWKGLIASIKEVESVLDSDKLDIEFGITKNDGIVIFQARPITSLQEDHLKSYREIPNLIRAEIRKFSRLNKTKHVSGSYTIFSDMSDWNPAEIIGKHPNPLDYSLYDFLIMRKIWHKGRKAMGYRDVDPYPLMVKFGGKPYVDTRGSFNSLIPNNIGPALTKKLMDFFLKKLDENHHLHDKVEFEILFSCYDLSMDCRLKELKNHGFTDKEIETIKNALLAFTNRIISDFPQIQDRCEKSIKSLTENRESILSDLGQKEPNYKNLLSAADRLLSDCQRHGTLPFSTMARISFISSILLESLKEEKRIPAGFAQGFMRSISTPLSEIQNDVELFSKHEISKSQFLKKYGHLRPGTYDITAVRYDMTDGFFDNVKFLKKHRPSKILMDENLLAKILSKHGLKFNRISFLDFIEQSITQRERLKFEFTKNLSEAIELIAKAGSELGFSRHDMSFLSISEILGYKVTKSTLKKRWRRQIARETEKSNLTRLLVLPPVISSKDDFYFIQYYSSRPNFITSKQISKEVIILGHEQKDADLANRIVIIENADPGYDWIFTKNPAGLITKYGGVASHMSIRCAEIGLPAAIGCGEVIYERLLDSSKVLLDAKNGQIIIQEQKQHDQYVEERKVLKSLGYIK